MGTGGAVTALSQRRDSELELVTVDTLGRIIQVRREPFGSEEPLQVATLHCTKTTSSVSSSNLSLSPHFSLSLTVALSPRSPPLCLALPHPTLHDLALQWDVDYRDPVHTMQVRPI